MPVADVLPSTSWSVFRNLKFKVNGSDHVNPTRQTRVICVGRSDEVSGILPLFDRPMVTFDSDKEAAEWIESYANGQVFSGCQPIIAEQKKRNV